MANATNHPEPAPADASADAFLQAFRAFRQLGESSTKADAVWQLASWAYDGAVSGMTSGAINNSSEAAIAALVGISRIESVLDGCFSEDGSSKGGEEAAELRLIREILANLWRYHDVCGAEAARDYAEYVGAVAAYDRKRWERGR